jgi:hypothetical protein
MHGKFDVQFLGLGLVHALNWWWMCQWIQKVQGGA